MKFLMTVLVLVLSASTAQSVEENSLDLFCGPNSGLYSSCGDLVKRVLDKKNGFTEEEYNFDGIDEFCLQDELMGRDPNEISDEDAGELVDFCAES